MTNGVVKPTVYLYKFSFERDLLFWRLLESASQLTPDTLCLIVPDIYQAYAVRAFLSQLRLSVVPTIQIAHTQSPYERAKTHVILQRYFQQSTHPLADYFRQYDSVRSQLCDYLGTTDACHLDDFLPDISDLCRPFLANFKSEPREISFQFASDSHAYWIGFTTVPQLPQTGSHTFLVHNHAFYDYYALSTPLSTTLSESAESLISDSSSDSKNPTPSLFYGASFQDTIWHAAAHITAPDSTLVLVPDSALFVYHLVKTLAYFNRPIGFVQLSLSLAMCVKTLFSCLAKTDTFRTLDTPHFLSTVRSHLNSFPEPADPIEKCAHKALIDAFAAFSDDYPTLCDSASYSSHMATFRTYISDVSFDVVAPTGLHIFPYGATSWGKYVHVVMLGLDMITSHPPFFLTEIEQKSHNAQALLAFEFGFFAAAAHAGESLRLYYTQTTEHGKSIPAPIVALYLQWAQPLTADFIASPVLSIPPITTQSQDQVGQLATAFQPTYYSVSSLETYQKCPYIYYFRYVLRQQTPEEPLYLVPPNLWGERVHAVLKELYQHHYPFTDELSGTVIRQIVDSHFGRFSEHIFEWRVKIDVLCAQILPALIDQERQAEYALTPLMFEQDFDLSLALHDRTMAIRGRIDVLFQLQNESFPGLIITDFKTGKSRPTRADVTQFRSLQFPIYQLATRRLFSEEPLFWGWVLIVVSSADDIAILPLGITPEGLAAESIPLNRKRPFVVSLDFFSRFVDHIFSLKQHIESGEFSPYRHTVFSETDRINVCSRCHFKRICTYEKRFN